MPWIWAASRDIKVKLSEADNMKVVIIGGVAGGATAAARLRRLDESAEIVVLELSLIHISEPT